jgi:hypothetical protein
LATFVLEGGDRDVIGNISQITFEVPQHRLTDLAMDWADAPYVLDGYNQILIVIDRVRKYLILISTKSTDTAEDTARVFVNYVVRIQVYRIILWLIETVSGSQSSGRRYAIISTSK